MAELLGILRDFGPLGSTLLLLALTIFIVVYRRRGESGGGFLDLMPERRVGTNQLLGRIAKLEEALKDHEEANAEGRRALHAKIESTRDALHEEIEDGLREVREAQAKGIESVRADLRVIAARFPVRGQ